MGQTRSGWHPTEGLHQGGLGPKCVCPFLVLVVEITSCAANAHPFQGEWTYISETSAVIYWQLDDISNSALSYVEYGPTAELGQRTATTKEPRWAHLHRLTGLQKNTTYSYRMVSIDPATHQETRSAIRTLATATRNDVIRVPEQVPGPPFMLDKPGATYLLTQDVTADGTAFIITAPDVTLDLDGHTVTFGNNTDEQISGVLAKNEGQASICNGRIVQGARCKEYSTAVESRWRAQPTEIFGVRAEVHLKCGYPIKFLGRAANVDIHHNDLYSQVTEIESRHYPGNDLLRLDIEGGNIHVHDNILTEGCHVGLRLSGEGPNVEADHNDIRHHQQYVNGYAIAVACAGADVHHNKVTSCGRGVHLTRDGIKLHDNYLDIYGHQDLDDMPAKSRPFNHIRVELHGIKFEGAQVKNTKVYQNFMRIIQPLPRDSDGKGSPEDKVNSGVYVRSRAASIAPDRLVDPTQNWEQDRWKGYWVKYDPDLPPALILGNDATSLRGEFKSNKPAEYTIYMKWEYVPATPLNVACYDPNAMNEVYDNRFIALTEYQKTRHGGYADSGQWASAVYFVGMDKGPAEAGKYSIYIHDNQFVSNDLFISSYRPPNMSIRIENNRFVLGTQPPPTEGHTPFRGLGAELEKAVKAGGNIFEET